MNKFSFKGFAYGLEDHLSDQERKAEVRSYYKDGKRNVAIDFDAEEDRIALKCEIEDYTTDHTDEPKEVSAFFMDGKLRVLIVFTEDEK